ncbi:MAG: hypothetical protein IKV17_07085, partial [Bacteroidaceae bacterium]|nr:hypothetical protein [Bacteroidaceae bacterium]
MKIFKLMAIALVAMVGLNSCSEDCDHEFIEHDYSKDLVGTWTYLEEGQAEAMVINPDGTFTTTGVMKGGSLYEEKGTIKVVNNKVTLAFDGDKETFEGRLELVAGKSLSLVMFNDNDVRLTYDYCGNDLSDEIVGMWVCNEGTAAEEDGIAIHTYTETGKTYLTTAISAGTGDFALNEETEYKVIGNLMFLKLMHETLGSGVNAYAAVRLTYTPNATSMGDIMTLHHYFSTTNGFVEEVNSFLRIKQSLNLTGKTYDYSSAYVTNAKGTDEDFSIFGNTFNMAKIEAGNLDVFFRSELFCVDLNANSIKQCYRTANGQDIVIEIPITVDGNKVTLGLIDENPAFRKVDMYMYQDADDSQLHIFMPTASFINYFANLQIFDLISDGKINSTDTAAIEKVFTDMEARVQSINV